MRKRRGREVSPAQVDPPQHGEEQHTAFQCFLVKILLGGRGTFCFVFVFSFLKKKMPEDQLLVTSTLVKHCCYQSLYRTVQSGQILTNNVCFVCFPLPLF